MGFLDLEYEDCVRDLKTTSFRPKKNSNYDRQLKILLDFKLQNS